MVTGNEYLGIQPGWNWYRLPGTTVEQDGRSLKPATDCGATHGTTDYAGGVSDGTYGAEAFNYNRYDVAAKKCWFFFDNEEVALGAAITSSSATFEVDTTLNQCLLTSSVSYETTANASQTFSTGTVTPANLKWVYQGGVGYFFLNPVSNATIRRLPKAAPGRHLTPRPVLRPSRKTSSRSTSITAPPLPTAATATSLSPAYASQMDSYLASNPIQVLRNDADRAGDPPIGAGHHAGRVLRRRMFRSPWPDGRGQRAVHRDAAAQPNALKLSASSPQALSGPLNLTLGSVTLSGASTWFDALGTATAGFNLPGGNIAGSTVGLTLISDGNATPTVSLASNDCHQFDLHRHAPVTLAGNTTFQEDTSPRSHSPTPLPAMHVSRRTAPARSSSPAQHIHRRRDHQRRNRALNQHQLRRNGHNHGQFHRRLRRRRSTNIPIILAGGPLASPVAITIRHHHRRRRQPRSSKPPTRFARHQRQRTLHRQSCSAAATSFANATGNLSRRRQAFRINGTNTSTFSGTITLPNNVKGELFGTTAGSTTPAGTGNMILTAGDAAYGNTLNTAHDHRRLFRTQPPQQHRDQPNLRQQRPDHRHGPGAAQPARHRANRQLGHARQSPDRQWPNTRHLSASAICAVTHPVIFQSVTLTGGIATFSPKTNGFGATTSFGTDLYLGNIQESVPNSGLTMSGLRTLFLNGDNTYSGPTTVNSGTLIFAPNPSTGHSTSNIAGITGATPMIVNAARASLPMASSFSRSR